MVTIKVPQQVFPGFKIISELTDIQASELIKYLLELNIGRFYGDIANDLSSLLNINGDDLLQAILSFSTLVSNENADLPIIAKNLAESYRELSRIGLNTKQTNKLKSNILLIISNFEKVGLAEKVRDYTVENSNNFKDFKLITDIRLLISEKNINDKFGIVLHKFYLEYQNSNPHNELHLHISLEDLINLKTEIDKAIERDKVLRETYSGDLKLI